jgi:hypothetical protein
MTWLLQSHLTFESNGHCLLFVDNNSLELANDISNLSQIYPIVKSMYPEMTSLHVVSFPIKKLIEKNSISFHALKAI